MLKKGDRVLDTHLGSGTIAIACYNAGLSLTACEISENYYLSALKKIIDVIPKSAIHTNDKDVFSLTFSRPINTNEWIIQTIQGTS